MLLVALLLGAFLAGSVPFGLLIARARGIDLRAHGSGNIGATNVGRVLGPRWFVVVFLLDFLKGFGPVLLGGWLLGTLGRMDAAPGDSASWLGVALAAVLGHVFCPWLKFKGGKGVATGAGVLVGVFPALTVPAIAGFLVFLAALRLSRYMSLASMIAASSVPLFVAAWFHAAHAGWVPLRTESPVEVRHMLPFLAFAGAVAALVVWAHRGNIARLRAGTEPRWPKPKTPTPQPAPIHPGGPGDTPGPLNTSG